jgi:hypothetical protein
MLAGGVCHAHPFTPPTHTDLTCPHRWHACVHTPPVPSMLSRPPKSFTLRLGPGNQSPTPRRPGPHSFQASHTWIRWRARADCPPSHVRTIQFAGIMTKTLLAPLDRVRILCQTGASNEGIGGMIPSVSLSLSLSLSLDLSVDPSLDPSHARGIEPDEPPLRYIHVGGGDVKREQKKRERRKRGCVELNLTRLDSSCHALYRDDWHLPHCDSI